MIHVQVGLLMTLSTLENWVMNLDYIVLKKNQVTNGQVKSPFRLLYKYAWYIEDHVSWADTELLGML